MQKYYVGKQPIYNASLGIYGYEMLFRDSNVNKADFSSISADAATSSTIQNVFIEIGLEKLVRDSYAFINVTEKFLLNEDTIPFVPEQVVLEILEDVTVSAELIEAVKRLKEEGFILALDDYIYNPEHEALVDLVDIIKLDVMKLSREELAEHVKIFKQYKKILLAEKIESLDEYDFCVGLGFDYYQGYFLGKPRVVTGESLPANKLGIMNLLALTHNPEAEVDEIANAISNDVTISYKILKLVNSAFFNLNRKIESVKDVVVIMGRTKLASWASVMSLASLDDKPAEMLRISLIRAKMCELLAKARGEKALESYFTVGLFSALDVLMDRELEEIIKPLPLSENIVAALLEKKGSQGEILACALASEKDDFEFLSTMGFTPNELFSANIDSIQWVDEILGILSID